MFKTKRNSIFGGFLSKPTKSVYHCVDTPSTDCQRGKQLTHKITKECVVEVYILLLLYRACWIKIHVFTVANAPTQHHLHMKRKWRKGTEESKGSYRFMSRGSQWSASGLTRLDRLFLDWSVFYNIKYIENMKLAARTNFLSAQVVITIS